MTINSRLQKLRQKLTEKGLDAILISQAENRRYLSGFNGAAGLLLITPGEAILATDFRYMEQAGKQAPDYRLLQITGTMATWLPGLLSEVNVKSLGFEEEDISFSMYRQLNGIIKRQQSPVKLVPVAGLVESLRAVKEPGEVELIARAAEISDNAFAYIENVIHTGMNEMEVAWALEKFMRENGSQTMPFDIIVASGPNAALPHARPSPRAINEGEPVVIDMGARVEGYSSDLTRTICLGTPDDTFNKIYDIVLEAQLTAIAAIREGMSGEEADRTARAVIERAGYGAAFGHSLGHSIGLETHENPRLGPGATDKLTSGMAFTIEPGIYLSGWGGVRIEDLVMLEEGRVRVVSKARKERNDKRQ